ncbi:alpha/beta hydrolase family protein [Patulibacter minatonensis]|uniref:alpha/beta hydrolase family protein n=1 Tax=Patulibacter minatonensis TaxID=298163 RepID=UPI00047D5FD9|nr:alpha/beta fold hydrolase [Patulibacter minatonensis]
MELPDGAYAGKPPKGLVMFVHGGAWKGRNPTEVAAFQKVAAPLWRGQGYAVLIPEYRAGARGVDDVVAAYDAAQRELGTPTPTCGVGQSAGGHLLLELAIRRPKLRCVVSLAGPTDLTVLDDSRALRTLKRFAVDAFGSDDLKRLSPALQADRIKAKVFQVVAATDPIVPPSQAELLEKALPGTRTVVLPGGPTAGQPFIHSTVDPAALQASQQAWSSFVITNLASSGR